MPSLALRLTNGAGSNTGIFYTNGTSNNLTITNRNSELTSNGNTLVITDGNVTIVNDGGSINTDNGSAIIGSNLNIQNKNHGVIAGTLKLNNSTLSNEVGNWIFGNITNSTNDSTSLSISNGGQITGNITGNGLGITNTSTGQITGNITANNSNETTYKDLTNAGEITGNILGSKINILNSGSITGNLGQTNSISALTNFSISNSGNIQGNITGKDASITNSANGVITGDITILNSTAQNFSNAGEIIGNISQTNRLNMTNENLIQGNLDIYTSSLNNTSAGRIVGNITGSALTITNEGNIQGNIQRVINGTVYSDNIAITNNNAIEGNITSSNLSLTNSGTLTGNISGSDLTIVNNNTINGTISTVDTYNSHSNHILAKDLAVSLTNNSGATIHGDITVGKFNLFENAGTIEGNITTNETPEATSSSLSNTGSINGNILAWNSNVTNTGTINGMVRGNNLEVINNGSIMGSDIYIQKISIAGGNISVNNGNNGNITGDINATRLSTIENAGTIAGNIGFFGDIDADTYSILNNTGTITGNITANHSVGIDNDGLITGTLSTLSSSIKNHSNIVGDINATSLSTIENAGTITGNIGFFGDIDADTHSTLNNTGTITGNITANHSVGIDNDGLVKGTISAPSSSFINHGTLMLSNGTSSLDTFENHGILKFAFNTDGTANNTTLSKLEARTIILNSGSTINIDVTNSSTSNLKLLIGEKLTGIIKATETLTADKGTLKVVDNSPLIGFKFKQVGNQIDSLIVKDATVSEVTVAGQGDNTAQKAAKVFDLISDNSENHPLMESTLEKLNELDSNEKVAKAVESTTPQSATSSSMAASQISSNIAAVVMQRQNPNMGSITTGNNSGDEVEVLEKNLWIKPYGSIGSQANKDGLNGFGVKSYGIGMGFDSKNKADQIAGLGLFFTNANVDMNNVSQETDIKSYSMLMYGSLPVIDNRTNFLYQLGYGLQKTDSRRDVFTGDVASADYTSKIATIDARLVRDYQIDKDLLLQPLVYSTYRNFKTPAYSETGAGALNLDVEQSSSSEMIVGLGTIATYKLNPTDKLIGSLSVGYDLKDDKNIITSSYSGASGLSFETEGIDNGRWSYDAGIGYEKAIDGKNSINVNYNFQAKGTDYTNNVVSANYIYKF